MFNITKHQENAHQSHNEILPHTWKGGYDQSNKQVLVRMWRKGKPHTLFMVIQTEAATMEDYMAPQKLKVKLPYDLSRSLLGIMDIRILKIYLHSHIYWSIIHDSQGMGRNLNTRWQMNG